MKIAVLTTTRPLRERSNEMGREVEALSPRKCTALAEEYDLIIIGSRASDDFYDRIRSSLPRKVLEKFRMYPRSFFDRFKRPGSVSGEHDDRDEGWKEVLRTNGINFLPSARMMGDNFRSGDQPFHWQRIADFIRDDRVTVIG
jgi:hypothetical protein